MVGSKDTGPDDSQTIPHGGRLAEARRLFPHATEPWIDLSTGINPIPYPVPPLPAACFARLPEPEDVTRLEAVAAATYGVADPACVAAAPGTQALIALLPRLRARSRVRVLAPTYAEHAYCWRAAGHDVAEVAEADALADGEVGVLCNPNNPDGRTIDAEPLRKIASGLTQRGGWLVVDEAFADFDPPSTSLARHPLSNGTVLLRSFGKAYGLAGLRLGFAIAAPAFAGRLRAALGPWAVSGPAIAAGTVALADLSWRDAAAHRLGAGAARLDALIARAGMGAAAGTKLFRLEHTDSARRWFIRLGEAGIAVRRFEANPDWLRFGQPGTEAEWLRLADALK